MPLPDFDADDDQILVINKKSLFDFPLWFLQ